MKSIIDNMKDGKKYLIGMVHCLPLPGTMNYGGKMEALIEKAVFDAQNIEKAGFDAMIIEPTLDLPSGIRRTPLHVAAMGVIASQVRQITNLPIGISFSSEDCEAAFAIAMAVGASFVRLSVFVDAVVFPSGTVYPCAVRAFEARQSLGAQDIQILADIQVKHSHMLYPDVTIEQSAYLAQRQGADAIIVTGSTTGEETPLETLKRVREATSLPIIAGSGVAPDNIKEQLSIADGLIIGSSIKEGGDLHKEVNYEMAKSLYEAKQNKQEVVS